jgi:hypothetical protein
MLGRSFVFPHVVFSRRPVFAQVARGAAKAQIARRAPDGSTDESPDAVRAADIRPRKTTRTKNDSNQKRLDRETPR